MHENCTIPTNESGRGNIVGTTSPITPTMKAKHGGRLVIHFTGTYEHKNVLTQGDTFDWVKQHLPWVQHSLGTRADLPQQLSCSWCWGHYNQLMVAPNVTSFNMARLAAPVQVPSWNMTWLATYSTRQGPTRQSWPLTLPLPPSMPPTLTQDCSGCGWDGKENLEIS